MDNLDFLAPCGMNCLICSRYLASKNAIDKKWANIPYCSGCRTKDKCSFQKKCPLLLKNKIKFCFECKLFPCERLKKLDNRYKKNFRMSMIENLNFIKKNGTDKFIEKEKKGWQCSICDQMISCHNGLCFNCNLYALAHKKKGRLYRWDDNSN